MKNTLSKSLSPYLLQHAQNPVHWQMWNSETLTLAKQTDKPILVSIGYSACHWCHVMEKESFEDDKVAELMNEHFVCIKVDREERPDVDAIYMESVQMMGVQGGWPLNIFLTSDGKPFWGGTYFQKEQWKNILLQIGDAYKKERQQIEESAQKVTKILSLSSLERYQIKEMEGFDKETAQKAYEMLEKSFDFEEGGIGQAPKFPMPSYYFFLLRYYAHTKNEEALQHAIFSLDKMAQGGIYDQVGGGFARYAVDKEWFLPHFEKMLYDNAQLVSLYAEAYTITKKNSYKNVVEETVLFLEKELLHKLDEKKIAFYSALDADSEGEEGKFYIWTTEEIENVISEEDLALFKSYYSIEPLGNWQESKANILHRQTDDEAFAQAHQMDLEYLKSKVKDWKYLLLNLRKDRIRPGLDDKILTSWNALTLKGLADAYAALGNKKYLDLALRLAHFIEYEISDKFELFRTYKNGKRSITGFLEDYAFLIDAYIKLYQVCFDEKWLSKAEGYLNYCLENFLDSEEELFHFTNQTKGEKLIADKKELFDNVIPSSNSVMASNLYFLGILFEKENYIELSKKMMKKMMSFLLSEPRHVSNWASVFTYFLEPTSEIAIVGEKFEQKVKELYQHYIPNKVVAATAQKSDLPLLEMREPVEGQTTIYVCKNKMCQLPVHEIEEALKQV